jgi:hypothetical protein
MVISTEDKCDMIAKWVFKEEIKEHDCGKDSA